MTAIVPSARAMAIAMAATLLGATAALAQTSNPIPGTELNRSTENGKPEETV